VKWPRKELDKPTPSPSLPAMPRRATHHSYIADFIRRRQCITEVPTQTDSVVTWDVDTLSGRLALRSRAWTASHSCRTRPLPATGACVPHRQAQHSGKHGMMYFRLLARSSLLSHTCRGTAIHSSTHHHFIDILSGPQFRFRDIHDAGKKRPLLGHVHPVHGLRERSAVRSAPRAIDQSRQSGCRTS